jgi:Lrp/AsnC family transcriptional regulator, leucine-responsive regulatory protein
MVGMADELKAFDEIDLRIVGLLGESGRMSWRELGEAVHLSSTSVGERVRRLERLGVISGYRAIVDAATLGRGMRAVVEVALRPEISPDVFESLLTERSEVTFAAYVTGAADYAVLVDCAGAEGLDAFTRWCKANGAAQTESRVVLRRVVG